MRLSETPGGIRHRAPVLGEHTGEVLAEIGYDGVGPCTGPGTHFDPDAATDSDKQNLKKLAADAGNAFSILNPWRSAVLPRA